jgi:hypothetical protein
MRMSVSLADPIASTECPALISLVDLFSLAHFFAVPHLTGKRRGKQGDLPLLKVDKGVS